MSTTRPERFTWDEEQVGSFQLEGEPDYEVIELSDEPPLPDEGQ